MSRVSITADIGEVLRLGDEYRLGAEVGLRRVTERGEQLVREEAPEKTRNLKQGVSSEVKSRGGMLQGEIVVTARAGRLGRREATLHLSSGKTKKVSLRAVPSFNYPESVATGTGVYGPKGAVIRPKKAKALLVPVASVPSLNGRPEAYVEIDEQLFVMRRFVKGTRPNRYDERAARRLEGEAQAIFNRALGDFAGGGQ